MADPFIGQIVLFAGPYVPVGWHLCDGTSLPIAQNQNLYNVIGSTYGGNSTNFNLPNFICLAPIGTGMPSANKPNIPRTTSNIPSGQTGGNSQIILTVANLPTHSHTLAVSSAPGSAVSTDPSGTYLANTTAQDDGGGNLLSASVPVYGGPGNAFAAPQAIGSVGSNAPINIVTPYIAMNYIIALTGVYLPKAPTAAPGQVNTTANL